MNSECVSIYGIVNIYNLEGILTNQWGKDSTIFKWQFTKAATQITKKHEKICNLIGN